MTHHHWRWHCHESTQLTSINNPYLSLEFFHIFSHNILPLEAQTTFSLFSKISAIYYPLLKRYINLGQNHFLMVFMSLLSSSVYRRSKPFLLSARLYLFNSQSLDTELDGRKKVFSSPIQPLCIAGRNIKLCQLLWKIVWQFL